MKPQTRLAVQFQPRPARVAFPITQLSCDAAGIIHTVTAKQLARTRSNAARRFFTRQLQEEA